MLILLIGIIVIPLAARVLKKAEAKTTSTQSSKLSEKIPIVNSESGSSSGKMRQNKSTKNQPTLTPTAIPTQPPITSEQSWQIQSVSSMKETKDRICNQPSEEYIRKWVGKAKELGANYVAIETPYDNPSCGDAVNYTKTWIRIIREYGLKVWHRHMPLAFEGIYDKAKTNDNFFQMITDYIINNRSDFVSGDIFTPIPEPQNGGISGITHCALNVCQFSGAANFNQWLRDAITLSQSAFSEIGVLNMKIGYYGFDGFVAWGDNNPDWNGILENETVKLMGNITIDHYPELVGDTMENDLNELQQKYPNTPIIIGEWGTVTGGDMESQVKNSMGAAIRPNVLGFNYWHMGMGGNESLINEDFSNKIQFDEVQSYFK